jgi:trimethylamine--corrinoid protein Co-methyltransferase
MKEAMPLSLKPILNHHQRERVHGKSLELLENVGIDFNSSQAAKILESHGCRVNSDGSKVYIPPDLVAWALDHAPGEICLEARESLHHVVLNGKRSHHSTDSQGTRAVDFETGEIRASTYEDLKRGLLFADALDMVEIVNVMVAATDVPAHLRTIRHFAAAFSQTCKHVRTGVLNAREVPFIVELAKVARGSDAFSPIFSVVDCTISPLMHDGPMTDACLALANLQVPIMIYPMPLAGGTSPITHAGTVLLHNIEFLSGLVLFQAANPGTPIIYGTGASQLDMQTGRYGGSPDGHSLRLALTEMAHYYNLPVNLFGLTTAASHLDARYGFEATSACLLAQLAGVDEIYSIGLLDSAQTLSLDKMVLDHHLARQIEIMTRSLPFDDDHFQADLINKVGIGGHYLDKPETQVFTRQEYIPVWPPAGEEMLDLVHQEAAAILNNHQPPPLPRGAEEEIEAIIKAADRALA